MDFVWRWQTACRECPVGRSRGGDKQAESRSHQIGSKNKGRSGIKKKSTFVAMIWRDTDWSCWCTAVRCQYVFDNGMG